ncbi:hypothetical protein [Desmospora activa]|uniref:Outer membrane lipoprotein-sorting protein n=1 Tax=Desmospora activa DSM 45169 TaxID=1121389 RepID=A0A2T4ZA55_9BACL|nr:hypothetical protein [Desmospora activa]PTM58770.1 hypothetical protein C8J48_1360 [Desmospora activa DSM 45169]
MRIGLILLSVFFCVGLIGCIKHDSIAEQAPEETAEKEADTEQWDQVFLQRIETEMKKDQRDFTLSLQDGSSFAGKEKDGEWNLTSTDTEKEESIKAVQEDGMIKLTRGDQTEELSTRQFGLVAPQDHFQLVRDSVQRVNKETKAGQDWYVVDLNKEDLGDKLGHWMGKPYDQGAASQASRKFIFQYRFQFDENHLRQMVIRVTSLEDSDANELVEYTFEPDK